MNPETGMLRLATISFTLALITVAIKLFKDAGIMAWIIIAPFILGMGFLLLLMWAF